MKYAVEMASGGMIHVRRFMTIGSGDQKLLGRGGGYAHSTVIS
jgi:hypothetical protein